LIDEPHRALVQDDVFPCGALPDAVEQVALQARVEESERKRREVGAFEVRAFVRGDAPRAAVGALRGDRLLLVARHLPRLDLEYLAGRGAPDHRRAPAALPHLEG
jgi:hypothetical protein